MRTYAVYRLYYGRDWVVRSIKSIVDHVDIVFVFFVGPWGGPEATWEGEGRARCPFPDDPDGAKEQVSMLAMENDKIVIHESDWYEQREQFSHFINDRILPDYDRPEVIVINEFDHLWQDLPGALSEFVCARDDRRPRWGKVNQTELWKPPQAKDWWKIPHRKSRVGPVLWDTRFGRIPSTVWHGYEGRRGIPIHSGGVMNVGYAIPEDTMRWKIRCALAQPTDSAPDPNYLERVYLSWTPKSRNLEISIGSQSDIPCVTLAGEEASWLS